jgi:hypothetical protein
VFEYLGDLSQHLIVGFGAALLIGTYERALDIQLCGELLLRPGFLLTQKLDIGVYEVHTRLFSVKLIFLVIKC